MELEFEIILNEEFFEEFGKLLHYDIKVLLKANHNDWFTHIVAHPYAYPNHNRQMSTSIFVSTKRDKILSSFYPEYWACRSQNFYCQNWQSQIVYLCNDNTPLRLEWL